jgi:hypothetical protein
LDVDDLKSAGFDVREEGEKRVSMETLARKPVHLYENRRRDDDLFVGCLQEARTCVMILVRAVHGRVKRAGIAD